MPRSPIAQWPVKPLILLKNLLGGWLPFSVKLIIAVVAALTWTYLTPSPDEPRTFSSGWMTDSKRFTFNNQTYDNIC
jgi:hypothetical protein